VSLRGTLDLHEFDFPSDREPAWQAQVERWYQVDAASFGLCELWQNTAKGPLPSIIFLASPGGCNEMDALFARTGATSPSKFVYTLPSIRSSALLQVLGWHGPILCLQDDPQTVMSAIREAADVLAPGETAWILGHQRKEKHVAFRIALGSEGTLDLKQLEKECREQL
jgi:hypothetical protein